MNVCVCVCVCVKQKPILYKEQRTRHTDTSLALYTRNEIKSAELLQRAGKERNTMKTMPNYLFIFSGFRSTNNRNFGHRHTHSEMNAVDFNILVVINLYFSHKIDELFILLCVK